MQRDEDARTGAPADERSTEPENPRRITTDEEDRQEWIDEDLAQDEGYRQAQSDAGGDATTPMTGRVPVGEVPPIDDGPPIPGDMEDEIPSSARNAPGTVDDIPYSVDEDRPGYKPPLEPLSTGDEETDLWQQQRDLLDEDKESSLHLEGLDPEVAAHLAETLGSDASVQADGKSATGSPFDLPHGGFPERPEHEPEPETSQEPGTGRDERE